MLELQAKRWHKEFLKLEMNLPEMLLFVCDMLDATSDSKNISPEYTKQYFADYYGIDIDTFHKWVKAFCAELWTEDYKKKKKFSPNEVIYIYECLGKCTFKDKIPRNRKELADVLFHDKAWRKSKMYEELMYELDKKFPNEKFPVYNLPPKLITTILTEKIKFYQSHADESKLKFYEERINACQSVLKKYRIMTEYEKQVKLRWLRRSLTLPDESEAL